jgi:hypothetical protein
MPDAQPVLMTVLAGNFVNQAAAFFALRSAAEKYGVEVRPDETDVIREAVEVRLAHYFRPAIVARIEEARGDDDTVILLFPSRLTAQPTFPPEESGLRLLGRFAGLLSAFE